MHESIPQMQAIHSCLASGQDYESSVAVFTVEDDLPINIKRHSQANHSASNY